MTKVVDTTHEDLRTFTCRCNFLALIEAAEKGVEKIKTHILRRTHFTENRPIYDTRNMGQPERPKI